MEHDYKYVGNIHIHMYMYMYIYSIHIHIYIHIRPTQSIIAVPCLVAAFRKICFLIAQIKCS